MRLTTALLALAALPTLALAQNPAPKEPPIVMAASSFATVEVHINSRPIDKQWYAEDAALTGPAKIAISYGQPHARGRQVEGGLIPRDSVWRFGANEATTLHSDVDLTIGGTRLERGTYALFLINGASGWTLVVNRGVGYWGTDYDEAKDVARIPLAARPLGDAVESLTIYLIPTSTRPRSGYAELGGTLAIRWGTTELRAPFTVVR